MASIKISELQGYPPPALAGEDFFPLVDSSSMITYRTGLDQMARWFTASYGSSLSASWTSESLSASYVMLAKNAISASWASASLDSLRTISASWASASLSSSWADTASWVVSLPNNRYVPYVDAGNRLATNDYFLRFDSASQGQVFANERVSSSGDVQITFGDNQKYYSSAMPDDSTFRVVLKGTSSLVSPMNQEDESVKLVAANLSIYGEQTKFLGSAPKSGFTSTRLYSGHRLQSGSLNTTMDEIGWAGVNGKNRTPWNGVIFPLYNVPTLELIQNYYSNLVKFKEGICQSVRRCYDAVYTTESFWQPFSGLRIKLDKYSSVNGGLNQNSTITGSVDTSTHTFWFPHNRVESNVTSVDTARLSYNNQQLDSKGNQLYDYYDSISPLYPGARVVIEFDLDANGAFDTASAAPPGYFAKSGSFNCIVEIISTGSNTGVNALLLDRRPMILKCVSPSVIPDHIFNSGVVSMPPHQSFPQYHGGSGSWFGTNGGIIKTATSGSSEVKNYFVVTDTDTRLAPYPSNLTASYVFSASFSPVYCVEYFANDSTNQGIQFYLMPFSCSSTSLIGTGSCGAGVSVTNAISGQYITEPFLSGSKLTNNVSYWNDDIYVKKMETSPDYVSVAGGMNRPSLTENPGKMMKIRLMDRVSILPQTSKLKQIIYLKDDAQLSQSFIIQGIKEGFADGQELTIYNDTTNLSCSIYGKSHPLVSSLTASVYLDSKVVLKRNATASIIYPRDSISLIYYISAVGNNIFSEWREI